MNRIQQHHFPEKESTPCTSSSPAAAGFSASPWWPPSRPAAPRHSPAAPRPRAAPPARSTARITLADRVPPPAALQAAARVQFAPGDLCEQVDNGALPLARADALFHLAAAVSGECEADFDLGMRSNLDATRMLLQACRHAGHAPVFVFSSSVAVF